MTNEKRIEAGKHHVSKTYIALTLFRSFWTVLLIAAVAAINLIGEANEIMTYINLSKLPMYIALGVVLLLCIVGVVAWLSYKRLTWEITEDEIHVYKGLIVRKRSHIPFRRIHSVDINAKILDRIFGVVTLSLDTAAGSAGTGDAKIPALRLSTAELLRTEIFMRKKAVIEGNTENIGETAKGGGNVLDGFSKENENLRGVFAGDTLDDMTPSAEYRLTNKELVLLCLSNGKAFALIFAGLYFAYECVGFLHDVNKELGETADELTNTLFSMGPIIIAGLFVVALIISVVISFLTKALTYGNFVARRYSQRIEVSTGLLQKKSTGVAVERIQTLQIKQGLLQRILGYAEISLETASAAAGSGNDQEQSPGVVVHPFIKLKNIDDYMDKLLSEFKDAPDKLDKLTGLAMRRSIFRYGMWTVLLIILPVNLSWMLVEKYAISDMNIPGSIEIINNSVLSFSIAIFVIMLVMGWAAWKGRAFGRNDRYVAMRKGVIGRKKIYVPKTKIQFAAINQNPFQKRVKLVTIKANTAASGSTNQSLKDIGLEIGNDYLGWIEHKH